MAGITGYEENPTFLGVTPAEAANREQVNSEILKLEKRSATQASALGGNIKARASLFGGDPEKYRGNSSQLSQAVREDRQKTELQLGALRNQRDARQTAQVAESRRLAIQNLQKAPKIDQDFVVKALTNPDAVKKELDEGLAKFQAEAPNKDFKSVIDEAGRLKVLAASLDFKDGAGPFAKGGSADPNNPDPYAPKTRKPGIMSNQVAQITHPIVSLAARTHLPSGVKPEPSPQISGTDRTSLAGSGSIPDDRFSRQAVDVNVGGNTPFSSPAMSTDQDLGPNTPRSGVDIQANELVAPQGQQLAFSNRNPGGAFSAGLAPVGSKDPFSQATPIQGFPLPSQNLLPETPAGPAAVPNGPVTTPEPGPISASQVESAPQASTLGMGQSLLPVPGMFSAPAAPPPGPQASSSFGQIRPGHYERLPLTGRDILAQAHGENAGLPNAVNLKTGQAPTNQLLRVAERATGKIGWINSAEFNPNNHVPAPLTGPPQQLIPETSPAQGQPAQAQAGPASQPTQPSQAQPGVAQAEDPKLIQHRVMAQELLKTKSPQEVDGLLKEIGRSLAEVLGPREAGAAEPPVGATSGSQFQGTAKTGLLGRNPMKQAPKNALQLIRVVDNLTNQVGWISPRDFNPNIHEVIGR